MLNHITLRTPPKTRRLRGAAHRSAVRRYRLAVFTAAFAPLLLASSSSSAQLPSVPSPKSTAITYHTVFYPPGGGAPIPRDTPAVITPLIPLKIPIDVDKKAGFELNASTTINEALDTVTIEFTRYPGSKGPLKLSAEVIATPPATTGLPRKKVHFGYDARGGAPKHFKGTIRFLNAAKTLKSALASETIVADYTVTPPPPSAQGRFGFWSVRVLGGMFNGTPDERTAVLGGGLMYFPISGLKTLKAGVGLSVPVAVSDKTPLVVRHTDNRPSGTLKATVTDQAAGRSASATIGGVPKKLTMQLGDEQLDYKASARVNSFVVAASLGNGSQRGQPHFIRVKARDLPTTWRAFLGTDERVGFTTLSSGRGIGELAVAADDVSPAKAPTGPKENSIALTAVPGTEFYAGARLFNVRKAIYVNFPDSKFLTYEFDAAQPRPLRAAAVLGSPQSSTALTVGVRQPPKTLSITSPNKAPTRFLIDASAGIPKLALRLERRTTEASGNLNLDADIQHIPRKVELCLASNFACGRRQDVLGRQTDLTWKAEQLFDLLSDVSLSVNTRGTAKKDLQLDLTVCTGPGSHFTKTGCHRPQSGLYLGARKVRFRDLALTFGGGSSCPPGIREDGLVLVGLHTAATGIRAQAIYVDTQSPAFQDCYGFHDAEHTIITSRMPDAVIANRYATIIDANGNPDDDLEGVGSIHCPSSFDITVSGWITKHFNAAGFLDDC